MPLSAKSTFEFATREPYDVLADAILRGDVYMELRELGMNKTESMHHHALLVVNSSRSEEEAVAALEDESPFRAMEREAVAGFVKWVGDKIKEHATKRPFQLNGRFVDRPLKPTALADEADQGDVREPYDVLSDGRLKGDVAMKLFDDFGWDGSNKMHHQVLLVITTARSDEEAVKKLKDETLFGLFEKGVLDGFVKWVHEVIRERTAHRSVEALDYFKPKVWRPLGLSLIHI